MKPWLSILSTFTIIFASYFLLFFLIIFLPLDLRIPVLFYRGILVLFVLTLIYFGFFWITGRKSKIFPWWIYLSALSISFSITMTFFILVPVTVDRSVSTFILGQIKTGDGVCRAGISKKKLQLRLIDDYIIKQDAVEKRLVEQLFSKTIREDPNGCYALTNKGEKLVEYFQLIREYLRK